MNVNYFCTQVDQIRRRLRRSVWLAVGVVVFWLSSSLPLAAQTNFYTICTNGPASNRVNVVLFAEGFRAVDYALFRAAATNVANALLATEPFTEYAPYLNVFAIAVPSAEAGSDHPSSSIARTTYFSSSYDVSCDCIITMPTNSTGQGRVDALAATYLPQMDLAILLVNEPAAPGGSDNGGKTAITATAANSISYIPVHESGHVLGKLGDEYSWVNAPGYPDVEEPNTTRETNRAAIKWNAWIDAGTPVPTPGYLTEVVGLFAGAHYHSTGWYRPKANCLMNSAGVPFCEVCREALVLSLYRRARPVQSSLPVSKSFTTTSNQSLAFSLSVLQPATHALSLQWFTNGVALAGATNASFSILPALLGNGTNTVMGRVSDPTPWVRNDPTNSLIQTQSWTVTVSVPQLQLKSPRWLAGGKFAFQVAGVAPQGFVVQGSSNFVAWTSLATNALVNGVFAYTNQTSGLPLRFYRAVTPP